MAALIEEGSVKILLETLHEYRGPGRKGTGFYNPTLEIDRDLTVAFCAYAAREGAHTFLDGLAATGIRGIRIAKEVGGDISVDINERTLESYELVKKNIVLNGVKARPLNHDLRMLLQQKKYDYIDMDPYGSPAPFIPYLFRSHRDGHRYRHPLRCVGTHLHPEIPGDSPEGRGIKGGRNPHSCRVHRTAGGRRRIRVHTAARLHPQPFFQGVRDDDQGCAQSGGKPLACGMDILGQWLADIPLPPLSW